MNKNTLKVTAYCRAQLCGGRTRANVFDIMYDTGLSYPDLKIILDALIAEKQLEAEDIKTYKLIGDFPEAALPPARPQGGHLRTDGRSRLEEMRGRFMEAKAFTVTEPFSEEEAAAGGIDGELLYKAVKLAMERGTACVSMFQRALPVGYLDACKLVDRLEEAGYISASDGTPAPRKTLITQEIFDRDFKQCRRVEVISFDNEPEDFLQALVRESLSSGFSAEIPERPAWDDDERFIKTVAERIETLIRADKKAGRQKAVKNALSALDKVYKTGDEKEIDVHRFIVYMLTNISNYYYVKLRDRVE